ncbi:MAG: hypothetical protein EOS14_27750 [Mesorhizobium sp.]|nr:MAG: hypothetical protein EOS14_27750 [Mesorhizobium sp.]
MLALYGAPLCPAGHLPHKEGDRQLCQPRLFFKVGRLAEPVITADLPPLGEMSGRTEGGAVPPTLP